MSAWMWIALQAAATGTVPDPASLAILPDTLRVTPRCPDDDPAGQVVVCGQRRDRYRLPLPAERDDTARTSGEPRSGIAAITPNQPCGIFTGERHCTKREARLYGYGGGRDPLTVLVRTATKVVDPDSD